MGRHQMHLLHGYAATKACGNVRSTSAVEVFKCFRSAWGLWNLASPAQFRQVSVVSYLDDSNSAFLTNLKSMTRSVCLAPLGQASISDDRSSPSWPRHSRLFRSLNFKSHFPSFSNEDNLFRFPVRGWCELQRLAWSARHARIFCFYCMVTSSIFQHSLQTLPSFQCF